jgi:hypothetical protein
MSSLKKGLKRQGAKKGGKLRKEEILKGRKLKKGEN